MVFNFFFKPLQQKSAAAGGGGGGVVDYVLCLSVRNFIIAHSISIVSDIALICHINVLCDKNILSCKCFDLVTPTLNFDILVTKISLGNISRTV